MFPSFDDLVGFLLMGLLFVGASIAGLALLAYGVIKRLSPSKRREEPLEADREQWSEELLEVDDEESGVVPGPETKPRLTSLPLYYDLLGLSPEAKPEEVLRAYREGVEGSNPASLPEGSEARRNAEERLQSIKVALHRIRKTWPEDDQQMAEAFEQAATERDDIGPGSRSADRAFPKNLLGLSPKEAETGQQFVRGAMFFWTLVLLVGVVLQIINNGSLYYGLWVVGIWYLGWSGLRALDKRLEPSASPGRQE